MTAVTKHNGCSSVFFQQVFCIVSVTVYHDVSYKKELKKIDIVIVVLISLLRYEVRQFRHLSRLFVLI